jgi:hypothetical protein
MDIDINYYEKENYLYFKFRGKLIFDEKNLEDPTLPKAIQKYNCSKILLDITDLDAPMKTVDRYEIGEYFAHLSQSPTNVKTAVLKPTSHTEDFTEIVAQNRGALFEFFIDKKEAIDWLLTG